MKKIPVMTSAVLQSDEWLVKTIYHIDDSSQLKMLFFG